MAQPSPMVRASHESHVFSAGVMCCLPCLAKAASPLAAYRAAHDVTGGNGAGGEVGFSAQAP